MARGRLAGRASVDDELSVIVRRARRVNHSRRRAEWARLCAEWERSGLRQTEFCRQHGLNVGTLRWWRSQLRSAAACEAASTQPTMGRTLTPTAFVPVTVTSVPSLVPSRRARRTSIDVVLRGRRRLRVGPDVDEHFLARIVLALEAIP